MVVSSDTLMSVGSTSPYLFNVHMVSHSKRVHVGRSLSCNWLKSKHMQEIYRGFLSLQRFVLSVRTFFLIPCNHCVKFRAIHKCLVFLDGPSLLHFPS